MAFKVGSSSFGNMNVGERASASALVVDDNPMLRILTAKLLSAYGFEVSTVNNGAEVVHMYEAGKGRFDLIVMDMEMPVLNGIQATKELRNMGVDCMIIGATACEDASLRQSFMEAGLDHLFDKPLDNAKLESCLKTIN